ncbi:MAG: stage II sporulation protein M [Lachnospiraceae bacterium]|nr:stage II sporulation protein M [Lachnospiraceae bacterium]
MRLKPMESRYNRLISRIMIIGFVVGILIMNIGKKILLENTGLLSEYTLYDMKYSAIDSNAFFVYVLQKRIGVMLVLAVLSTTWLGMAAAWTGAAWLGISFGMLVMASLLRYGLKGILLVGTGVFPQALIYFPVALFMLQWSYEFCSAIYYPERLQMGKESFGKNQLLRKKMIQFLFLLGVVIIGCILESYVNPTLVLNLLKIF